MLHKAAKHNPKNDQKQLSIHVSKIYIHIYLHSDTIYDIIHELAELAGGPSPYNYFVTRPRQFVQYERKRGDVCNEHKKGRCVRQPMPVRDEQ